MMNDEIQLNLKTARVSFAIVRFSLR